MKLPYSTKKWEKELKAAQAYDGIISTLNNITMLGNAYDDREKGRLPAVEDEATLFFLMGNEYRQLADYEYLMNKDSRKSLAYLIKYIELGIKAYSLYQQGEMIKNNAVKNSLSHEDFINELAFTAVAAGKYETVSGVMKGTVIDALYNGCLDEARDRVSAYTCPTDEGREVYYRDMCFLKNAVIALTDRDTETFSHELEPRIRKYRKNMVGYSTIIDTVSAALIKLAEKAGVKVHIDVIEIPVLLMTV